MIKLDLDKHVIKRLSEQDKVYLEKFVNLRKISMKGIQLEILENLPELPKLQYIRLEDNLLSGLQLVELIQYQNLTHINIANNMIDHLSQLRFLNEMPHVTNLNIRGNPVFENLTEQYKAGTFETCFFLRRIRK